MKKKDLIKLREKSINDLKALVIEMKLELVRVQSALSAGQEKNLKKVKNQKHELAQILTIVREKEIMERESKTGSTNKTSKKREEIKKDKLAKIG